MQTGRFPSATRVKSNHNIQDVVYKEDLLDAVEAHGYRTGIVGKTGHSYLRYHPERFDYFKPYTHLGERGVPKTHRKKIGHFFYDFGWKELTCKNGKSR